MDTNKIKELRESTGLSFGEIKKALDQAGGDDTRAIEILNTLGASMAEKKSARQVKEGLVVSYVHGTGKKGSMVEVLCETDFVARNEDFKTLAKDIAMHIISMRPATTEELMDQEFVKDPSIKVRDLVNKIIAKTGENIQIGKFVVFEL